MKIKICSLVLNLWLVLSVAACTPAPQAAPASPSPAPTTAAQSSSATVVPVATLPTPVPATPVMTSEFPLATSIEDIVGTWRGLGTHSLINQFNADGTNLVAATPSKLPDNPDAVQQITFEGTNLVIFEIEATGLASCGKNAGIYQVQLINPDMIKFIAIKDSCRLRKGSTEGMHKKIR